MWLFVINNWNLYAAQMECIVLLGKERQGYIKRVSFLRIVHMFVRRNGYVAFFLCFMIQEKKAKKEEEEEN